MATWPRGAAALTGTATLAADLAASDHRPIRPARIDTPDHWATIGGALGQRLAFATQHAPPYYALLGAHHAGLADWATLQRAAAQYPTHTGLDPELAAHANQLRPLPGGGWLDLDRAPTADHAGRAAAGARSELLLDLAARIATYLARHAPPGQLATTHAAEAVLARACVVLTELETAYRGGQLSAPATALWADPTTTA